MNIQGKNINPRFILWVGLHVLIVIDIILISAAMLLDLPSSIALDIQIFDFIVCIILLIEWFIVFLMSTPKTLFLKQKDNWIELIASIPFDVLLPVILPQAGVLRFKRYV